jgi:hypothetical protein
MSRPVPKFLHALLLIVGFFIFFRALTAWHLIDEIEPIFAGLALGVIPAATPKRPMIFSAGMVIWLAFSSVLYLNGALDRRPPVRVQGRLVQKWIIHGRYGPGLHIAVSPSWRPGHDHESFEVDEETFNKLSTGDSTLMTVHLGTFGLPWGPTVSNMGNVTQEPSKF